MQKNCFKRNCKDIENKNYTLKQLTTFGIRVLPTFFLQYFMRNLKKQLFDLFTDPLSVLRYPSITTFYIVGDSWFNLNFKTIYMGIWAIFPSPITELISRWCQVSWWMMSKTEIKSKLRQMRPKEISHAQKLRILFLSDMTSERKI